MPYRPCTYTACIRLDVRDILCTHTARAPDDVLYCEHEGRSPASLDDNNYVCLQGVGTCMLVDCIEQAEAVAQLMLCKHSSDDLAA